MESQPTTEEQQMPASPVVAMQPAAASSGNGHHGSKPAEVPEESGMSATALGTWAGTGDLSEDGDSVDEDLQLLRGFMLKLKETIADNKLQATKVKELSLRVATLKEENQKRAELQVQAAVAARMEAVMAEQELAATREALAQAKESRETTRAFDKLELELLKKRLDGINALQKAAEAELVKLKAGNQVPELMKAHARAMAKKDETIKRLGELHELEASGIQQEERKQWEKVLSAYVDMKFHLNKLKKSDQGHQELAAEVSRLRQLKGQ